MKRHFARNSIIESSNRRDYMKQIVVDNFKDMIEATRENDLKKIKHCINSIDKLIFPLKNNMPSDPMWLHGATIAFDKTLLCLLGYYTEEDDRIRQKAQAEKWTGRELENALDNSWNNLTLYHVYQIMAELLSIARTEQPDILDENNYLTLFFDKSLKSPWSNKLRSLIHAQNILLRLISANDTTILTIYELSTNNIKQFLVDNHFSFDDSKSDLINIISKRSQDSQLKNK